MSSLVQATVLSDTIVVRLGWHPAVGSDVSCATCRFGKQGRTSRRQAGGKQIRSVAMQSLTITYCVLRSPGSHSPLPHSSPFFHPSSSIHHSLLVLIYI